MTGKLPLALFALIGEPCGFHLGKGLLFFAIEHVQDTTIEDITQVVFGEDEMVATIDISIVLHYGCMSAPIG